MVRLLPGVTLLSSQCLRSRTAAKSLICWSFFILLIFAVLSPQSTRILSIAGCSSGPAASSSSWMVWVIACMLSWIHSRIFVVEPFFGLLELNKASCFGLRRCWSSGSFLCQSHWVSQRHPWDPWHVMGLVYQEVGCLGLCDTCCLRWAFSSFNFSICSNISWLGSFGALDSTNLTISSPNLLMVSNLVSQSWCVPSSLIPMTWLRSSWECLLISLDTYVHKMASTFDRKASNDT